MNRYCVVLVAIIAILLTALPSSAQAQQKPTPPYNNTTINVVTMYGADNTGVQDDTAILQQAVNDAKQGTGNTVLLPAGTYLIDGGTNHNQTINILGSTGLTFTGASSGSTMIWFTRADQGRFIGAYGNTNLTIENMSVDVQKVNGQYDLGIGQGTITAINYAANQVTVAAESGYPLLNRSDIAAAPSNGYGQTLWLQADPTRNNLNGGATLTNVAPSGNGTTAVLTLSSVPNNVYIGEKWCIYLSEGVLCFNLGGGNYGATLVQNINYYGAGMGTLGDTTANTGTVTFNNIFSGPPSYQNDRLIASSGGWPGAPGRGSLTISNSTFLRVWDDCLDLGLGYGTTITSQPAANQVLIPGTGDYQANDQLEFIDNTDSPVGASYGQCTISGTPSVQSGNTLITLSQNVTVHNLGKDLLADLTQIGPITATNDTFNDATGRRVNIRSGVKTTVTGCTFEDNTPLVLGGIDSGEGPDNVHNVTVTGNTFLHNSVCLIWADDGYSRAPAGSNVTVSGNRFLNGGRGGMYYTSPLTVQNVTNATVSNNWFDNNWGANAIFQYDATINVTGNVFMHPNETQGMNSNDNSVVWMQNVAGAALSGNLVYSPGSFTDYLVQQGTGNSGINGTSNGIIDIDNPLAFYLSYDSLVMDRPASGTGLDQAVWTGGTNQKWQVLPTYSNPGQFTMNDSGNGQYVGNGNSTTLAANIVEENQAWTSSTSMAPTADQLWTDTWISSTNSDIINGLSNYDINVNGASGTPGDNLIQYFSGSGYNHNFETVAAPALVATSQFGTVSLNWTPVPYATSYNIGRSTTAGGSYATIASNLATSTYLDSGMAAGTYYYVVTTNGLPVSNGTSNEAVATTGGSFAPVNIASAFDISGIEPNGWNYQGMGYDNWQATYSSSLMPKYITANGCLFKTAPAAVPDAVADQGQRIALPAGFYTTLQLLGGYVAGGSGSTGTFQPTITYANGSSSVLSQGMANWCAAHSQPGETDAATFASRNLANGTSQNTTCYVHAYSIPINSTLGVSYLTLPSTGNFRILAMDLSGANNSVLTPGQYLLPGQYIVSPSKNYILTMQTDGNLVLYNGSSPANEGSAVWATGTYGDGTCYATLQIDGNFLVYQGTPLNPGAAVWSSGTYNMPITSLQLTNTPEVQLLEGPTEVWQKP